MQNKNIYPHNSYTSNLLTELFFRTHSRRLSLESGSYARLADGAVLATLGNTSVLVTAVSKASASPQSFLPLTVDYKQKYAAAGRIPSNYLKREMGQSEQEILTSRVIGNLIHYTVSHIL